MRSRHALDELRRLDPAGQLIPDGPLDDRARADLASIREETLQSSALGDPAARRTTVRTRRVLTLAASVAVAVTVVAVGLPGGSGGGGVAYAATPPLLPAELNAGADPTRDIGRLSSAAAGASQTTPSATTMIRYQSWFLATEQGRTVRSVIEPQLTDVIRGSDDSGQIRTVIGDASADQPLPPGQIINDSSYNAGEFPAQFPRNLSSDPDELLDQLKIGHPIDDLGTAELFRAIADVYREQQPRSDVRAAMLRLLDERNDVISLGQITDRAGRTGSGLAVDSSYSGLPTRYLLIFDDQNGQLLADEEVLFQTAGRLNVVIPAVISYELRFVP